MYLIWIRNILIGSILFALILQSCSKEEGEPEVVYDKLSEYNFFLGDISNLTPAERVIPYELITPLFSDYAIKPRFIFIPEGESITYEEDMAFTFPTGAVLIKNFLFLEDFRNQNSKKTILETRLLIKRETEWESATYIWNEAQDDAELSIVGSTVPVDWIDENGVAKSTNYIIPNKNDCKGCHSYNKDLIPIGPKARNLNKDFAYVEGSMNQLEKWTQLGILAGAPASSNAPTVADWSDSTSGTLEQRARAYLDVNCAHCHNPHGAADNSALNLGHNVTDSGAFGICKTPVAAGGGSGGLRYGIVPGKPEESIMIFRMSSTEPDEAMPELGKTIVHDEGVQLITDWIKNMNGDCN